MEDYKIIKLNSMLEKTIESMKANLHDYIVSYEEIYEALEFSFDRFNFGNVTREAIA